MSLLSLIKANKLIFSLIVIGSLGIVAAGVGCGVYFGVNIITQSTKKSNSSVTTSMITTTTTPDCQTTHFWDGSKCVVRKTYEESCTASYQCTYNVGLECDTTSSTCLCASSSDFWDTNSLACSKIF